VEEETEEGDLEGEEVTIGIDSNSTAINFSRVLSNNSSPFSRIKVHILNSLHSPMDLFLVAYLLPGPFKVPTPSSTLSSLDFSPTNGLLQVLKKIHRVLKVMWKKMVLKLRVGWQSRCRRRRMVEEVKFR
jgi:hypothetical protein